MHSRVDFALSEKVLWPAVLSTLFWQHCSGKSRSDIYTLYGLTLACCQMRTSFLKHKSRMLRDLLSEALLLTEVKLVDSNILLAIIEELCLPSTCPWMIRVLCYSCYQKLSYGLRLLWVVWALTPWVNLQIMFSHSSCLVGNNVVWISVILLLPLEGTSS